jgi:opacity protein-like surface antigen
MADDASTRALEQKIQQLEAQLRIIRNELDQVKSEAIYKKEMTEHREKATTAVPEEKLTTTVPEKKETTIVQDRLGHKHHMLFFRGGFTHAMQRRNGTSIQSNVAPVGAQDLADRDGWYVGAGFDFSLTNNIWGLLPRTEVMSELMFEYKEFADNVKGNALANNPTQLAGGAFNPRNVTVTQVSLSAAPKIKFMEGSKIRPWIIPAGLALHVISPPSESISFWIPGVMFGAGVDYNFWKDFYIGIDGRYHLTGGKADGIKVDGMTAGGYLGIGF